MNTILTDDERREIHRKAAFAPSAVDALIAETEAAVLAKLREQTPQPAHAPGYCKHCKQYTIEKPLAPQAEQAAEPVAWMRPRMPAKMRGPVTRTEEAYGFVNGWNACVDAIAANAAPQSEQAAEPRGERAGVLMAEEAFDKFLELNPEGRQRKGLAIGHKEEEWTAFQQVWNKYAGRPALASTEPVLDERAAAKVLQSFEIKGPDEDGLLWLVLHGTGTTGRAMFNLGKGNRIAAQVALLLEQDRRAALASTERQPPAQWQEAMKAAREALDGMLQVHGVTQNDAIRHDTIPTSWVELSDEARAALAQLDSLGIGGKEQG